MSKEKQKKLTTPISSFLFFPKKQKNQLLSQTKLNFYHIQTLSSKINLGIPYGISTLQLFFFPRISKLYDVEKRVLQS